MYRERERKGGEKGERERGKEGREKLLHVHSLLLLP